MYKFILFIRERGRNFVSDRLVLGEILGFRLGGGFFFGVFERFGGLFVFEYRVF